MTAAAAMAVLAIGAQQLGIATVRVLAWVGVVALVASPLVALRWYLRRRRRTETQTLDVPDFMREPERTVPRRAPRRITDGAFLADGVTDAIKQILREEDGR